MPNYLLVFCFLYFGMTLPLLCASWPMIYPDLSSSVEMVGVIGIFVFAGLVLSAFIQKRPEMEGTEHRQIISGLMVSAVSQLGFSFANHVYMLFFAGLLHGFGTGLCFLAALQISKNQKPALSAAQVQALGFLGGFISCFFLSFAKKNGAEWRLGFMILAICVTALCIRFFTEKPSNKKRVLKKAKPIEAPEYFIRIDGVAGALAIFLLFSAVIATVCTWFPAYFVLHHEAFADHAAAWTAMLYLGLASSRVLSPMFLQSGSPGRSLYLGLGLSAFSLLSLFIISPTLFSLPLFVLGLGLAVLSPAFTLLLPQYFGKKLSEVIQSSQEDLSCVSAFAVPALFGLITGDNLIRLLPFFALLLLILAAITMEATDRMIRP